MLSFSNAFAEQEIGGADLLQLSVDHHVRFSVVPSPEALSVRVEGLRDDLNRVNASMKSLKQVQVTHPAANSRALTIRAEHHGGRNG